MSKLIKFELINRKGTYLFALAAIPGYLLLQLIFGDSSIIGFGSMELGITFSAFLLVAGGISFALSFIFSIARDFFDDSRYLIFLVPHKQEKFLLSRYLVTFLDCIIFFTFFILPFILSVLRFTGAISYFKFYPLEFNSSLIIQGLLVIFIAVQLVAAIYFSVAITKMLDMKMFFVLLVYILTSYLLPVTDLFFQLITGNKLSAMYGFFFVSNVNINDPYRVAVYFSGKAIISLCLFLATSSLLNKKINL